MNNQLKIFHLAHPSVIRIVLVVLIAVVIFGCATIVKGTKQDISIQSDPPHANFTVKTKSGVEVFRGVTPATVKLPKKNEYVVTIELAGYKETSVYISQSFELWALGNIICGGIIGLAIDALDGAMWKLEPDQIMVTLATALLENNNTRLYVVFYALDNEGQLRSMAVPLIKNAPLTSIE